MLFTNDLDLNKNAIRNAIAHPVGTDPTSPVDGQFWYRTDTDRLMVRQNGVTKTVAVLGDITQLTAAEILAALITVDGASSGLDADLLDGQQGTYYATAASVVGLASTTYVDTAVNNLVDAAPGALNTLNELAAALGDDPNFATTITTNIAGKTGKYAVSVGDGTTTSFTVTHSLGTKDVVVSVRQVADDVAVFTDWTATTSSAITVTFGTAPTTNQYRVVVVG